MMGLLAFYPMMVLPSALLVYFGIGYAILRWRDREDPQLGPKALFVYFQTFTAHAALAALALFLVRLLTNYLGDDSKMWRALFGVLLASGGLCFLFTRLLAYTNVEERPAARRLFQGWATAISLSLTVFSFVALLATLFADGFEDSFKAAFAMLLVYLPASYLMLRYFFGIHMDEALRGSR